MWTVASDHGTNSPSIQIGRFTWGAGRELAAGTAPERSPRGQPLQSVGGRTRIEARSNAGRDRAPSCDGADGRFGLPGGSHADTRISVAEPGRASCRSHPPLERARRLGAVSGDGRAGRALDARAA